MNEIEFSEVIDLTTYLKTQGRQPNRLFKKMVSETFSDSEINAEVVSCEEYLRLNKEIHDIDQEVLINSYTKEEIKDKLNIRYGLVVALSKLILHRITREVFSWRTNYAKEV